MQDQDLEYLKGSDQYSVEVVTYRLVKSYRLRVNGNATVTGVMTEIKDLKDEHGFEEVQLGSDEKGSVVVALKVTDLSDIGQLVKEIGDNREIEIV